MTFRYRPFAETAAFQEEVLRQLSIFEGHVQTIEIGIETPWGGLILGLDQAGRLVVLLIHPSEAVGDTQGLQEDFFSRLIGIYGWILGAMPLLMRRYAERGLEGSKPPRMFVVAPEFSRAVVEGLPYLRFQVACYRYQGLESEGEDGLMLSPFPARTVRTIRMAALDSFQGLFTSDPVSGDELLFFESGPRTVK